MLAVESTRPAYHSSPTERDVEGGPETATRKGPGNEDNDASSQRHRSSRGCEGATRLGSSCSVGKHPSGRKASTRSDPWHKTVDAFKVALSAQFELPLGDQLAQDRFDGIAPAVREEIRIQAINLWC
jgi:hypothetical protein